MWKWHMAAVMPNCAPFVWRGCMCGSLEHEFLRVVVYCLYAIMVAGGIGAIVGMVTMFKPTNNGH